MIFYYQTTLYSYNTFYLAIMYYPLIYSWIQCALIQDLYNNHSKECWSEFSYSIFVLLWYLSNNTDLMIWFIWCSSLLYFLKEMRTGIIPLLNKHFLSKIHYWSYLDLNFFVLMCGESLFINPTSLIDIRLIRFFIFPWVHLDDLLTFNDLVHFIYWIYWHNVNNFSSIFDVCTIYNCVYSFIPDNSFVLHSWSLIRMARTALANSAVTSHMWPFKFKVI